MTIVGVALAGSACASGQEHVATASIQPIDDAASGVTPARTAWRTVTNQQAIDRVRSLFDANHPGNIFEAKSLHLGDLFAATGGDAVKAALVGRKPEHPVVAVLVRGEIAPSFDITGKVQLVWEVYAIDAETGEVIATWGSPSAAQANWFEALREHS